MGALSWMDVEMLKTVPSPSLVYIPGGGGGGGGGVIVQRESGYSIFLYGFYFFMCIMRSGRCPDAYHITEAITCVYFTLLGCTWFRN